MRARKRVQFNFHVVSASALDPGYAIDGTAYQSFVVGKQALIGSARSYLNSFYGHALDTNTEIVFPFLWAEQVGEVNQTTATKFSSQVYTAFKMSQALLPLLIVAGGVLVLFGAALILLKKLWDCCCGCCCGGSVDETRVIPVAPANVMKYYPTR